MVTNQIFQKMSATPYQFNPSGRGGFRVGDHSMVTCAPTYRKVQQVTMPIRLTEKQQQALSLERTGFTHAQIAGILGLRNRESATRLIGRACKAANAARRAAADMVGCCS